MKKTNSQKGSVMVVVLLLMTILTLIGLSAIETTNIELQIAKNDLVYKSSLSLADGALYPTIKLIKDILYQGEIVDTDQTSDGYDKKGKLVYLPPNEEDEPSNSTIGDSEIFFRETMGFSESLEYTEGAEDKPHHDRATDLSIEVGGQGMDNFRAEIDVMRRESKAVAGGAAEFGAGYAGAENAAGMEVLYRFTAYGFYGQQGKRVQGRTKVEADYRRVPVPGGL